jgi:hypothetical protein
MFEHLSPEARAVAAESAEYRKLYCRREIWIAHDGADQALARMAEFVREPKTRDMPVGLVTGPAGTGRGMLLRRLHQLHEDQVLLVRVPETYQERRLALAILKQMKFPTATPWRCDVWRLLEIVVAALRQSDIRVIGVLNADQIAYSGRHQCLGLLRRFKEDGRVGLLFRGNRPARRILRSDPDLAQRAELFQLTRWGVQKSSAVAIARALRELPLRLPTTIDEALMQAIFESTAGIPGRIFELLRNAAVSAIDQHVEFITPRSPGRLRACGGWARRGRMSRASPGELWWRFERAPAPLPSEAPSSWFTRVAHAHHLLAEELAELHACSLPALDRSQSNALREILERAGILHAPAPCQTFSRLIEEGLFTAAAPRWQLSDWWCYCAACLRRDLSINRAPYIRNHWVQPLAFACIEHRQALQPWPYGHERLRADASTSFDMDALFRAEAPILSDGQLALALCLNNRQADDWLSWVRCLLAASAALAHKTGVFADGPPAIWFLTPNDRMSPVKGNNRVYSRRTLPIPPRHRFKPG